VRLTRVDHVTQACMVIYAVPEHARLYVGSDAAHNPRYLPLPLLLLRQDLDGASGGDSARPDGDSSAAAAALAVDPASTAPAADYADEPTLPEDLEDIPELRPGQAAAGPQQLGCAHSSSTCMPAVVVVVVVVIIVVVFFMCVSSVSPPMHTAAHAADELCRHASSAATAFFGLDSQITSEMCAPLPPLPTALISSAAAAAAAAAGTGKLFISFLWGGAVLRLVLLSLAKMTTTTTMRMMMPVQATWHRRRQHKHWHRCMRHHLLQVQHSPVCPDYCTQVPLPNLCSPHHQCCSSSSSSSSSSLDILSPALPLVLVVSCLPYSSQTSQHQCSWPRQPSSVGMLLQLRVLHLRAQHRHSRLRRAHCPFPT
jgi:hypothetical protein